jgi:hypothetical protein
MWRSFFLAIGVYVCLLGVEALAIDKAVLKPEVSRGVQPGAQQEIIPAAWAPWSLLACGAVVMLYSFTIPQRVHSGGGA